MKQCPFCAEEIQDAAVVCKHCGRDLATGIHPQQTVIVQQPQRLWSPGIAAVLSLLIPGAGQMYKGQVANGLAWLFFVVVGYVFLVIPGAILHLCCIVGASQGDPYGSKKTLAGPPPPPSTKVGSAYGCYACGKTVKVGDATCKHCGVALAS